MKITANQYAQSLYRLTAGKSQQEIDVVVEKFAKLLKKKKQQKMIGKIEKKFGELYNQENGIVEAEIISAGKLGDDLIGKLRNFIKEKYSAKEVKLENRVDVRIKGGFVLRVGNEILDESVLKKMSDLKKELA